jgi:hypothetical protein
MKMKKNKMNFNLMLLASAIAGTAFIYSCTKDNERMNPQSVTNPPVVMNTPPYTPCPNVENPANPYDQAGVVHNEILDYILMNKPQWSCGDNSQWVQTNVHLTATYMCDNGYGVGGNDYNATSNMLNDIVDDFQTRSFEDIVADIGSEQLQNYNTQLLNEVESYTDSTQIDSLLNSIKRLESVVMASTLSPDEQKVFLEGASIARYSSCYWFQEYQKSVSDWHCPSDPIPAGKFNWGRGLGVAFADICGGLAFSWLGPVGSTVGAAVVSGAFALE